MATTERSFLNADFIGEDRLEERGERVKEKVKIILRESGKGRFHWGKWGKTKEGKGEQGDVERFTTTV